MNPWGKKQVTVDYSDGQTWISDRATGFYTTTIPMWQWWAWLAYRWVNHGWVEPWLVCLDNRAWKEKHSEQLQNASSDA